MRVKVTLQTANKKTAFIGHRELQRELTSLIYTFIGRSDPGYARWLHDEGWQTPTGIRCKLFTYSKLFCPQKVVD